MSSKIMVQKQSLKQSQTKYANTDGLKAKADDEPLLTHQITSFDEEKKQRNANKLPKYSPTTSVFDRTGYKVTTKISTTIQGSIYNATNVNGQHCVLKRTSAKLYSMRLAMISNKYYDTKEDIVNEATIMKYLTKMNPQSGLTKVIDFFCDGKNYFLLMEYGGKSFWKHVNDSHKLINKGKMKLKVWKQHVKILFKQMCSFINWLHNIAKVAHLDLSLENMLIKGCVFKNGKFISHGQIYLIDYGLAKCFGDKKSFKRCKKYVGKHCYQAPKVYHKIPYNAFKADIWSLGIILFMMTFGCGAYNIPTTKDGMFVTLYSGNIKKWSKEINKSKHSSKLILDILTNIFCDEQDRWSINDIIKHKYIKQKNLI